MTFLEMAAPPSHSLLYGPMAMQALAVANERGIRVPEDISITGHDGILVSGMTVPALTTVRQPIPEMGRLAVERLLAHIGRARCRRPSTCCRCSLWCGVNRAAPKLIL
ncbi:MAG: substrate-binding domain-containing protein [Caldilineaceae bacterium]